MPGTYQPSTGTYTSASGVTQSRRASNVPTGTTYVTTPSITTTTHHHGTVGGYAPTYSGGGSNGFVVTPSARTNQTESSVKAQNVYITGGVSNISSTIPSGSQVFASQGGWSVKTKEEVLPNVTYPYGGTLQTTTAYLSPQAREPYSYYPNKPFLSESEASRNGMTQAQLSLFNVIPNKLDPYLAFEVGKQQSEFKVNYPGTIAMNTIGITTAYGKAEKNIATEYTLPVLSALESMGFTREAAGKEFASQTGASIPLIGFAQTYFPGVRNQIEQYGSSLYTSPFEKPLTTGVVYTTSLLLPSVLGWGGVATGSGMKALGFSESTIATSATWAGYGGKAISIGLGGLYAESKIVEIGMNPIQAGSILGRATSTEIIPALLGGLTSRYIDIKLQDYYLNQGKKSIGSYLYKDDVIGKDYIVKEGKGIQILSDEKISRFVNLKESATFPYKRSGGVAEISGGTGWSQLKYVSPITGQTRLFTATYDIQGLAYPIKGGFGTSSFNLGTTGIKWTQQDYIFTQTSQSIKLGYGKEKFFDMSGKEMFVKNIAASTKDYMAVGKGNDLTYLTKTLESGKTFSTGLTQSGYLNAKDISLYGKTQTFTGFNEIRADIADMINFNLAGQKSLAWSIPLQSRGGQSSLFIPRQQPLQLDMNRFLITPQTSGELTFVTSMPLNYGSISTLLIPKTSLSSSLSTLGLTTLNKLNTRQNLISLQPRITSEITSQKFIQNTLQGNEQIQIQQQNQIQQQIQVPQQTQIITNIFNVPVVPLIPPFVMPGLPGMGYYAEPRRRGRIKRKYKYQPSLSQVLMPGMKFSQPKELSGLGYSPLSIRGFESLGGSRKRRKPEKPARPSRKKRR